MAADLPAELNASHPSHHRTYVRHIPFPTWMREVEHVMKAGLMKAVLAAIAVVLFAASQAFANEKELSLVERMENIRSGKEVDILFAEIVKKYNEDISSVTDYLSRNGMECHYSLSDIQERMMCSFVFCARGILFKDLMQIAVSATNYKGEKEFESSLWDILGPCPESR